MACRGSLCTRPTVATVFLPVKVAMAVEKNPYDDDDHRRLCRHRHQWFGQKTDVLLANCLLANCMMANCQLCWLTLGVMSIPDSTWFSMANRRIRCKVAVNAGLSRRRACSCRTDADRLCTRKTDADRLCIPGRGFRSYVNSEALRVSVP